MTNCTFTPTESTIRDGKQEYVCVRCGHKRWSKYTPDKIHRNCKVAVDPTWPCQWRGDETGRVECPTCNGMVFVKTFQCSHFGDNCQIVNKLPGVRACNSCPARVESTAKE